MLRDSMKVPKWLRVLIPAVLIVVWFGLGGIGGPYFGRIEEVSDIDLTAFLPKSAEATKVTKELSKFRSESTFPAVIVFEAESDRINEAGQGRLDAAGATLEPIKGIEGDVSPVVMSENRKAAFMVAQVDTNLSIPDVLDELRGVLNRADLAGTSYSITGPAGFAGDLNKAFAGIDGILLLTALAVVFVILIVVYRSAVLPVVVLLTSIFALSASIIVVWNLAKADVIQLNGQVQGILFILVIGAATDYSLLYVSRYREELYRQASTLRATTAALRGSFEPIIASGGTVIVGLLCLLLSDLASNKALGPVGAIGIAFSMASALTFLPSVLYVFGRTSFWPVRPKFSKQALADHRAQLRRGIWHRVGQFVSAKPRTVWITSTVILLVAATGVTQLRADGVAQSDLILGTSEARDGQKVLNKYFPDGSGSPAQIIASSKSVDVLVTKVDALPGIDGVSVVATGVDAGFKPLGKQQLALRQTIRSEVQKDLATKRSELDQTIADVEITAGPFVAANVRAQAEANTPTVELLVDQIYPFKNAVAKVVDGRVLIQATLADAPDSNRAKATITELREAVRTVDSTAIVGGTTAAQLDSNTASIRDRQVIIPIVLVAITIILMLLLRAVIAPILLLLTTVISFAASLGVAAWLFNDVWNFPGADPSVILYAFVFLVALGIDYNIFLMTRVREETIKVGTAKGVIKGLVVTGGVITSAGVVLAATFAALGVIPILFLFQLAFIVAFGVLLDTLVVRSLLVPALIRDLGPIVWWPSKLKDKV